MRVAHQGVSLVRRSSVVLVSLFALLASLTSASHAFAAPGQATPSITTQLNMGTIRVGTTDFDTAQLSLDFVTGGSGSTVTYEVFDNSGCTGTPVQTDGPLPIDENTGDVPNSDALTFPSAGTFYWVAVFSGDENNDPAQSGCADEQLTVNQATPSITTLLNSPSITVGTTDFDTANISSAFVGGGTGGSVTYTVYGDDHCGTSVQTSGPFGITESNGNVPNSAALTFSSAGTFWWVAAFSGDSNNAATSSGCAAEPMTVGTASPTISTSLHAGTITVGTSDFDTANISSDFVPNGTGGTVTYTVYSDNHCGTSVQTSGPFGITESNGNVPNSAALTFAAAGTFYWVATFSGDSNNTGPVSSGCAAEPLLVNKATPTISTLLTQGSITVGGSDTDTADISSAFVGGGTGGSVTYTVYSDNHCGTSVKTSGPFGITESNGNVPNSGALAFGSAGTFYWVAAFSGDSNNAATSSGCSAEPLVVGTTTLTISTLLHAGSITAGGTDFDTADLSTAFVGGGTGGSVTYTVYSSSSCTNLVQSSGPFPINESNGSVTNSDPLTFTSAGTFYWVAAFTGDSNNDPASSGCSAEPMVVGKASPTISTLLNAGAITVGSTDFDTANISSAFVGGGTGGTVTYTVYSDNHCGTSVQTSGPLGITESNGNVPNSAALPFNAAGTFYWVAAFSGDSNNTATSSGCSAEPLAVSRATPTISTLLNAGTITVGATDFDTANISSDFVPNGTGGTVTYTVYSDNHCGTSTKTSGPFGITESNGNVPNSAALTFAAAGTFYWVAAFSGDSNNAATSSGCSAEPLTVANATPTISTRLNAGSITAGATDFDTANLSIDFVPDGTGGTVTYTVYSDNHCGTSVQTSGPLAITESNGNVPNSATLTFTVAGTFYWVAAFSGDSNNDPVSSTCSGEPMVVGKASPTITTAADPATAVTGTGLTFGDRATFAAAAAPTGSVTFTLYSNTSCTTAVPGVSGPGSVSTSGGVSTASFSTSWTPTTPGVYYWLATYPGDSNNNAVTTACQAAGESVTVANVVAPALTALSQTAGPEGGGAIVTLTGTNLIGTTEVDFGSLHVTATGFHGYPCGPPLSPAGCFGVIGSTLISVFTPQASAAGPVSVTVTNPAGSATLTTQYTYVAPGAYSAMTPFRICDTRPPPITTNPCTSHTLGTGHETVNVQITGVTGPSGQSVPSGALAAVINVTGINHGSGPTYLTAYPAGTSRPTAASVSLDGGATQANLVVVQLSSTGQITVFNAAGSADVILDVQGYFAPATGSAHQAGEFHSMAPLRMCDTRATVNAKCASGALLAGSWRRVVLSGLPSGGAGGMPTTGAAAAVFNITATQGTAATFLSVEAPNSSDLCTGKPTVANLNPRAGANLNNRIISALGPQQDVCVYNNVGRIQVVLDLNGWFGDGTELPATPGALFYSVPPTRICDTRSGMGTRCSGHPLGGGSTEQVAVAGVDVVPARGGSTTPVAVVANLTGVAGTASTYLLLYPSDAARPTASDLNPAAHDVVANLAIVGLSTTAGKSPGDVSLYNNVGTINAVLDVAGWFQ